MKQNLIIYHGSQQIVEVPRLGIEKKYNDYGQGFYCTENNEKSLFAHCLRWKNRYVQPSFLRDILGVQLFKSGSRL